MVRFHCDRFQARSANRQAPGLQMRSIETSIPSLTVGCANQAGQFRWIMTTIEDAQDLGTADIVQRKHV